MHKNIKKINDHGYEIPFLVENYTFPKYHFKTQFLPIVAYRKLKSNNQIKKLKLGKINYLELKNGVKGKFCSINKYFEVKDDFKPSFCFYACEQVAEQLREKKIDFDFVICNRSKDKNIINRHAVIRTILPGLEKPVIIDGSISAIIEEELFFNIHPNQILAVYHNKDIPKDIEIGHSYDAKTGGQYLMLEDKTKEEKQFHNVEINQREI